MLSSASHTTLSEPFDPQIDTITLDPNAVLRDLLQSDRPLFDIAAEHKLSLRQLIIWCEQPAIRNLLSSADELANLRASHTAAQSRHLALAVLTEQCRALYTTPRDRECSNRAARAILRECSQVARLSEACRSPSISRAAPTTTTPIPPASPNPARLLHTPRPQHQRPFPHALTRTPQRPQERSRQRPRPPKRAARSPPQQQRRTSEHWTNQLWRDDLSQHAMPRTAPKTAASPHPSTPSPTHPFRSPPHPA